MQSSTTTNYTVEFPVWGTHRVSTSRVQWMSLTLGKQPSMNVKTSVKVRDKTTSHVGYD